MREVVFYDYLVIKGAARLANPDARAGCAVFIFLLGLFFIPTLQR